VGGGWGGSLGPLSLKIRGAVISYP